MKINFLGFLPYFDAAKTYRTLKLTSYVSNCNVYVLLHPLVFTCGAPGDHELLKITDEHAHTHTGKQMMCSKPPSPSSLNTTHYTLQTSNPVQLSQTHQSSGPAFTEGYCDVCVCVDCQSIC